MIIRGRAPLRLGFAGGGTDLSPYCDDHGGCVLNACISMFAHASIVPRNDQMIEFNAIDLCETELYSSAEVLPLESGLRILKGVHNYLVEHFNLGELSYTLSTYVDAPAGSGLGSSSTLVVAIVRAFAQWLKLPFGEYDLAHIAYIIERKYLNLAGGKQDQYAVSFGGFNFMEFYDKDLVIVNPLRINQNIVNELNHNLVLFFTGQSRESAHIIEKQIKNTSRSEKSLDAMHMLKTQAVQMKQALLRGNINEMGELLHLGWLNKKKTAPEVSNSGIDAIYGEALEAGALGGKISGAGGGGFMMIYCPGESKYRVIKALQKHGCIKNFVFVDKGAEAWIIK